MHFHFMTYMATPQHKNPSPRDMKLKISCLFTLHMLHTKLGKDWPSSSWEDDVNGRRTPHNARRTTTGANPQHSGDLTKRNFPSNWRFFFLLTSMLVLSRLCSNFYITWTWYEGERCCPEPLVWLLSVDLSDRLVTCGLQSQLLGPFGQSSGRSFELTCMYITGFEYF